MAVSDATNLDIGLATVPMQVQVDAVILPVDDEISMYPPPPLLLFQLEICVDKAIYSSPRRRDHGRDPYDRHDYGGRPDYDRRYGGSYRGSGRRDDYDRRDDYRRSPARDDRSYSPRRGSPPRHRDSPPSRRDSPPYENKRSPSPSPTRE